MRGVVLALSIGVAACGAALSAEDQGALHDAAQLSAMAYGHSDGGPERALIRGSYCAVEGVQLRQHLQPVDAGIQCR